MQTSLENLAAVMEQRVAQVGAEVEAAIRRLTEPAHRATAELREASRRWLPALAVVCCELPKRGWYLSGLEPVTFIGELASGLEAEDWEAVDQLLVTHTEHLEIDEALLENWLRQEGAPTYTIERVRLVLDRCKCQDHTVATIVGLTVVDELSRYLYDDRDFTTKRAKQPRPQIGVSTPSSQRALGPVAKDFVASFGIVHEDIEPGLLDDDNYFNRAAILHGKMRRSYGPKDSAKIKLLLMFLICGSGRHGDDD
jgi:hypothetical protein